MKRIFFTLCFLIIFISYAQALHNIIDSLECIRNYQIYRDDYKKGKLKESPKYWRWVFNNCPSHNENIFKNGPKIIKSIMTSENQNAYLDTLMMIYDRRIQYYHNENNIIKGYVLGKKGSDLLKYDKNRYLEASQILKRSIDIQENKSSATTLLSYFKSIIKLEKDNTINKTEVFEAYILITDIISYNLNNNKKSIKNYETALSNIQSWFAPYASCDDLIQVFSPKFKATPHDFDLIEQIIKMLKNKSCEKSELYFSVATAYYDLQPSASSAAEMGLMNLKRKNYKLAMRYYKEAIEMEDNNVKLSFYNMRLSEIYQIGGSYSLSRNSAYRAIQLNSNWGDPYIKIGDLYCASVNDCGENNLERSMIYCLAVDLYIKAKMVDSRVKDIANKRILKYSKFFASREECFMNDIDTEGSYTIDCWINKTTKIRTRD